MRERIPVGGNSEQGYSSLVGQAFEESAALRDGGKGHDMSGSPARGCWALGTLV